MSIYKAASGPWEILTQEIIFGQLANCIIYVVNEIYNHRHCSVSGPYSTPQQPTVIGCPPSIVDGG